MKTLILTLLLHPFLIPEWYDRQVFDNYQLLASTNYKVWYHYNQTPDDPNTSYKTISADNTFIFYPDGTFKFDHGTITEDPSCKNECSSDLVNLTGTWKFTRNGRGIKVTTAHETGKPASKMEMVLIDATIIQLTENVFSFKQLDEETNKTVVFEFRTK